MAGYQTVLQDPENKLRMSVLSPLLIIDSLATPLANFPLPTTRSQGISPAPRELFISLSQHTMDFLITIDGLILSLLSLEWIFLAFFALPSFFIFTALFLSLVLYSRSAELSFPMFIRSIIQLIPRVFFREIQISGTSQLKEFPPGTAILFVAAPHTNQFMDGLLLYQITERAISFIMAAVSLRRPMISFFAKPMGALPVERPQDLAKAGSGKFLTITGKIVTGENTKFKEELEPGFTIFCKGRTFTVESIESNSSMIFTTPANFEEPGEFPMNYKFSAKLHQDEIFEAVWDCLGRGECLGVFPEGASYDNTQKLPFKPGAAIFSLGALAKYPQLNLKIVPVGLNYFSGHRFRSRVYIDIGESITPSPEAVKKYQLGGLDKREACSALLAEIQQGLECVTTSAPDYETMQLIWAVRRLYKPPGLRLTTGQKLELTRRFESFRVKLKENEQVKEILEKIKQYTQQLETFGVRDQQIEDLETRKSAPRSRPRTIAKFFTTLLLLLSLAVLALPGLILNLPILILTRFVSRRKALDCQRTSLTPESGRDIIASWKVLVSLAILPLCFIIYPILSAVIGAWLGFRALDAWAYFVILQLPMMFGAVKFIERGKEIALSLKPLILIAWAQIIHYGLLTRNFLLSSESPIADPLDELESLREQRRALSSLLRSTVDGLGPQVFGPSFSQWRIVKSNQKDE